MKKTSSNKFLKCFLYLVLFTIIAPMLILILWSFTSRWPWPNVLPEAYSLRAIKEVFIVNTDVFQVLMSNIVLSLSVAILSVIIGIMTSRALTYYDFALKKLVKFLSIAPILVPGSVFAMGVHVLFIKMSLTNNILGVVIVHLIYTLPYSISIINNLTESIGMKLEMQAYVLGASPLQSFIHIMLPLLSPGIVTSVSMAYITSFSQYFLTLLIGGGKVKTISLIMVPFIEKGDRSLGSAYALVFVTSTLFIFLILDALIKIMPYKNKKGEF